MKVGINQMGLLVGGFLLPTCAIVYFAATYTLYGSLDTEVPTLCWLGLVCTGLMFFVGCFFYGTSFILDQCGGDDDDCAAMCFGIGLCFGLVLFFGMLASFLVNLWYMANLFPFGCLFYDHGGMINITEFNASTQKLVSYKGNTADETAEWQRDWDLVVDCNIKLEMFWFWAGGRECLAILAHVFAALWVAVMKLLEKILPNADLTNIAMDIVDLQDFFLLLLEDDLIVAYWDPVLEGDANNNVYWLITVLFFFNGAYMLFWPFLQAAMQDFLGIDRWPIKVTTNVVSLLFCEIPFFCIRLYLSNRCNILASSLLIKNFLCGIADVAQLYSLFCLDSDDDLSDSDDPVELARMLKKKVEEEKSLESDLKALLSEDEEEDDDISEKKQKVQHVIESFQKSRESKAKLCSQLSRNLETKKDEEDQAKDQVDVADAFGVAA